MAGSYYFRGIYTNAIILAPQNHKPVTITSTGTIEDPSGPGGVILDGGGWTLVNYGVINAFDNSVDISSGDSTVTNAGLIEGNHTGVNIGPQSTVSNTGTISVTDRYPGVNLLGGGTLTNGSPDVTTALISGGIAGVLGGDYFPGSTSTTVTNYATIAGGNAGVLFRDGGSVTNIGPAALIDGNNVGVYISNGTGTLTNTGTVSSFGPNSHGVDFEQGGTIVNGSSSDPTARISGGLDGVFVNNAAATVTNYGQISANAHYHDSGNSTDYAGVKLNAGGQITNAAGASISGYRYGVWINGGGTVNNAGLLSGGINGIVLQGAGSTIDNFGTIIGTGGTAVSLLNTDETLRIEAGSTIVGAVIGLQGSDTIDLVGAQVTSIVASNDTVTFLDNTSTIVSLDLGASLRADEITTTSDGQGGTDVVIAIRLDPGPTAGNGATTVGHNETVNLTSLISGLVTPGVPGDTETITAVSATSGSSNLLDGVVSYTAPSIGPDTLTYTVADEYGDTATGSVNITVDTGPIAANGATTLGHNKIANLTSAITALVSPGIADDTETITAIAAALGTAALNNGIITYTTPTSGPDALTYTVTDQHGDTANGTLNVAVDPGPTAGAASITLVAGQSTDLTSYLLGLDIPGITGDTLTLTGDNTTGTHGTVTLTNGDLSYSAPSTSGTDSFGYSVSDQYGDTASATVTVKVASSSNIGNGSGTVVLGSNSGPTSFGGGNVTVVGGNGNDQISGGNGTDSVTLGNGSDTVRLGDGSSTVSLGNGNDSVTLGDGSNAVTVGNGNDTLKLGNGANTVTLGTGSDTVTVGNQNNSITATGSATSTDTIAVGDGSNTLKLGAGTYKVTEGNGADTIILGNGQYNVTAGNGNPDLFIYTVPSGKLTMSFKNNDELVFRNSGFDLGTANGHGTASLQAIAASLFSTNTDGSFATTANRFAYNTATGDLYYNAAGSTAGSTKLLIADLTNKPHLSAASLFFTS